jgi:hypothetical protein
MKFQVVRMRATARTPAKKGEFLRRRQAVCGPTVHVLPGNFD